VKIGVCLRFGGRVRGVEGRSEGVAPLVSDEEGKWRDGPMRQRLREKDKGTDGPVGCDLVLGQAGKYGP
jgi:hypothetical protein